MFSIGDIVIAVKPRFSFEQYEGTIMNVDGQVVGVKWVYDANADTLEYDSNEVKHIS